MRVVGAAIGTAWALVLLGCTPVQVGSSGGGDCTSHYDKVADGPTRAALERATAQGRRPANPLTADPPEGFR